MPTSWEEVAGLQAAPRLRDGESARRSIVPALKLLSLSFFVIVVFVFAVFESARRSIVPALKW